MKKTIALFSLVLIISLIFSSCGEKIFTREFTPEKSFTLHMKAEKDNKNFEADITCLGGEDITISFTYPEELSGFSVKAENDSYKINVFGLMEEMTDAEINDASLLNVLIKTIRTAVFTNHGLFTEEGNYYTANLTVDTIPVYVSFSKDGFLQQLSVETLNFSAQFEISG